MRYLVIVTILATPAVSFAQDSTFLESSIAEALQTNYTNRQDYVAFRVNGAVPVSGEAFQDLDRSRVSYDDLFRIGASGLVEGGILLRSPRDYWTGGYISLGGTVFSGDDETLAIGKLKVDDFEMITAMAGFRIVKLTEAGFTWEIHLGAGWIQYAALDGKIAGAVGDVDIYDRSGSAVGEGGVRLGWGDEALAFQVGLSGRFAKGPKMASGFIDRGTGGTLFTAQLDVGLRLGF